MAKEIVVVSQGQEDSLFSCLRNLGYSFANPASGEVSGWTADGERKEFDDVESAVAAFRTGAGIQLWKSDDEDLFVLRDLEAKAIRVWLDGFSAPEANEIFEGLREHDIVFEIDYDVP